MQSSATAAQTKKDPISSKRKEQHHDVKLEMKAQAMLERLFSAKENLKDVRDTLKAYKVTSDKFEDLKKTRKELTEQINDEKIRIEEQFQKDKTYNELREKVLDCEEKIAVAKQDLKNLLKEQALKGEIVELQLEVNGQPFKLQTQAKVALYFNGKEEK